MWPILDEHAHFHTMISNVWGVALVHLGLVGILHLFFVFFKLTLPYQIATTAVFDRILLTGTSSVVEFQYAIKEHDVTFRSENYLKRKCHFFEFSVPLTKVSSDMSPELLHSSAAVDPSSSSYIQMVNAFSHIPFSPHTPLNTSISYCFFYCFETCSSDCIH